MSKPTLVPHVNHDEGDNECLKAVDQTKRKGIWKYLYILQQVQDHPNHAFNISPK